MTKIVIMSDNHGEDQMMAYIKSLEPDGDIYVHCGDSEAYDAELLDGWVAVKGNNDWDLPHLPRFAKLKVDQVSILITHGQFYGFYNREKRMIKDLKSHRATVMISGHSHMPVVIEQGRYLFVNPGSTTFPRGGTKKSYAVMYINGSDIQTEIKELKQ